MFDAIKSDLPNFPDEIIRVWLLPIAESGYGWPPPQGMGKWKYALMLKDVAFWKDVSWELVSLQLDLGSFTPLSRRSIIGLAECYTLHALNEFSNLENSRERFDRIKQFILAHGNLPAPPVLFRKGGLFDVVDGNHRISALNFTRALWASNRHRNELVATNCAMPLKDHQAWIATHSEIMSE